MQVVMVIRCVVFSVAALICCNENVGGVVIKFATVGVAYVRNCSSCLC